ncbi:MAG TPA: hypothetical protein VLE44_00155 [Candidatus Saccharimonadales bacterium]|nr:hypothetical protein [Candidatus Saccharimonadales bacterium]
MTVGNYVTKGFLTTKIKKLKEELHVEIEESEKRIKDSILDSEVKVLGELQRWRDDDEAHKFSHERVNLEIEELQKKVRIA